MKKSRVRLGQLTVIAASIQLIFADAPALANPTGPQVVNGAASFQRPDARSLSITNTPGTIINWQGFSVGAGELTRFIQQSPSSAVLNRVVGADISQIYGQLLSNGRVFLINPSGIVIGPGAVVDTAGFVASTLNMLDGDFLAGKLRFQGDASSGSIINQGWIRTGYGGQVILVAPQIENSGLIHTPGGEIILAAGKSLTITSLDLEGVQFEVQAPTDSVLNVGKLLADGGAVGVFAGSLRHSGEIRANALVYDEAGRIVLKAQNDIQLTTGSTTSADGRIGGDITVQSTSGLTRVAGTVSSRGSAGQGGDIKLLGDRVAVVENAVVDASGSSGGGTIRVGGDFQGGNPDIQNSNNTIVGIDATLRADATQSGDGGRVIVWSDDKAQFYGGLSAQGGPDGGNGGFAEVSGKQNLIFAGSANLGAPKGSMGDLLLDPLDLYVFNAGGGIPSITDETTDFPSNAATVSPATLAGISGNVSLVASRYMRISDPIDFSNTQGKGLTAQVGTYTPPLSPDPLAMSSGISNMMEIGANITTSGGAVSLIAPIIQNVGAPTISTSGGAISLNTTGAISASQLALIAGSGDVTATSSGSSLFLNAVTAGSFTAMAPSSLFIFGPITTTNGAVSLNGSFVSTGAITSGSGNVLLTGTSVSTGIVDTSGSVVLMASGGSVSSTVNNASSLTATGGSSVFISSTTDLNVNTVTSSFSTASLTTSGGAIRPTSASSQVSGFDVTLSSTDTGSGGGIGVVGGTPLNVNVQRQLNFTTNAGFNVLLNGAGPNRLFATLNPANATTGNYTGSSITGSGFSLMASADTSTVTLSDLTISNAAFNQFSSFISVGTSGNLVADSVSVPTGNTSFASQLPVSLSASGDLTLGSYTRAAGGLLNQTAISSSGAVILGSLGPINAGNDNVTVSASSGITVSGLIANGNVTLNAGSGAVNALADNPGVDVTSGGTLSITGVGIGTAGFINPLDIAAATVVLTSAGGAIGTSSPVVANTQNLTVNAANGTTFDVDTGALVLTNLNVTATPFFGGTQKVITNNGVDVYDFVADMVGNFTFNPPSSTGRNVMFTSTSGDIALGAVSLGTGNFSVTAQAGGILGTAAASAANVTLSATTDINYDNFAITATGSPGSIVLKANNDVFAGDLDALTLIDINQRFCCSFPAVSVGTIGSVTSPATVTINGSTVDTGAVTGAGNITLNANSGLLTVGGAVTTANGSTITLLSTDPSSAFQFTDNISAGATGTVNITSNQGIVQTGGSGITAGTVSLLASAGDIFKTGAAPLVLNNTTRLTLDADADININASGTTLTDLTITKRNSLDVDPVNLILAASQSVAIGGSSSDFDVEISSLSPLNFSLTNAAGGDISLVGGGIVTSGGTGVLRANSGSIDTTVGGIATGGGGMTLIAGGGVVNGSPGITTSGGAVNIQASGAAITLGTIATAGGSISATTFCASCNIDVNGALTAGSGSVFLTTNSGGSIAGSGSISSSNAVTLTAGQSFNNSSGEIGASGTPLAITSPMVTLNARREPSNTGNEGDVRAALVDTSTLNLSADRFFDVSSTADFTTLSVATKGSGTGTMTLTSPSQTFSFTRPSVGTFEIGPMTGPQLTNATFQALDGDLLVNGPTTINAANLTLLASSTGDVRLVGTAANPLVLNNTNQTFGSTAFTRDLLISGVVSLNATGSQSLSAGRDIIVQALGGAISIEAANQTISTSGAGSRIQFLGGAGTGESVTISATNSQLISADTSFNSSDMLLLKGGDGDGASVTLSYSGPGDQQLQVQDGIVTIEGGSGQNAFAKIESISPNQQQICRNIPFVGCAGNAGTLNILGGSGDGAFAQMTASGSQFILVSSATTVKAGSGNGANALLQAGTTQNAQLGNLTVQGLGGAGATATAQILAGSTQSLSGSAMSLLSGAGVNSFAMIATSGNQSLGYSSLNMSASGGGSGSFVEIQAGGTQNLTGFGAFTMTAGTAANTDAIIEGNSQTINGGAMTLTGGTGTSGSTSDAVIRNLAGNQTVQNTSSITLNGGMDFSTTGILNLGTGTQTITSSGALSLLANLASTANAPVQVTNSNVTRQTVNVQRINVQTSGAGDATLSSAGDQYIHTNNTTTNPSIRVAALGSGTASIQAIGSQLLEVDYPQLMQGTRNGLLSIGDPSAIGNSLIQATDQSVFAGSILVQGGSGAGSLSKLSATNVQTISTLLGGIEVSGGAGDNSLATVDPITQTILTNGSADVSGGSGGNADGSIVSAGTQTLVNTNGDVTLTGGSGAGADAIISSLGAQNIISSGNVALTGGTGINTDALISSSTTQFIQAGGDISLIGGPISGSDAIISNIGAQQGCSLLSFQCGAQQTLLAGGSIILSPGIGNALIEGGFSSNSTGVGAFLSADTTQQTLANMDEFGSAFDALAPGEEDPDIGRKVPICR